MVLRYKTVHNKTDLVCSEIAVIMMKDTSSHGDFYYKTARIDKGKFIYQIILNTSICLILSIDDTL